MHQIRVRQRAARRRRDAAVYDYDLFRPDYPRCLVGDPVQSDAQRNRYLAVVADRLVPRLGSVRVVLQNRRMEKESAHALKHMAQQKDVR